MPAFQETDLTTFNTLPTNKMKVYLAKFMMYYEVYRMYRERHSISQISEHLVLNRRTVSKGLAMNGQDHEDFLVGQSNRKKLLLP